MIPPALSTERPVTIERFYQRAKRYSRERRMAYMRALEDYARHVGFRDYRDAVIYYRTREAAYVASRQEQGARP